jgi:hypothetical protein
MLDSSMAHLLDDAWSTVQWARRRHGELRTEVAAFCRRHADAITSSFDAGSGDYHYETSPRAIPEAIPLLLGEVACHTRSALDYLIYALSWLDAGEPEAQTQYPIAKSRDVFAAEARRRLRGLTPEHVARVECHQPYRGAEWLLLLQSLSNPAKHRHLNWVTSAVELEFFADGHPVEPPFGRVLGQAHRLARLGGGRAGHKVQGARGGGWGFGSHPAAGEAQQLDVHFTLDLVLYGGPSLLDVAAMLERELIALLTDFDEVFAAAH